MVSLHISSEQQEGKNRADLQKVHLPAYSSCISAENYFSLYWLPHKNFAEDSYETYQSIQRNFEFFGLPLKYKKEKNLTKLSRLEELKIMKRKHLQS